MRNGYENFRIEILIYFFVVMSKRISKKKYLDFDFKFKGSNCEDNWVLVNEI